MKKLIVCLALILTGVTLYKKNKKVKEKTDGAIKAGKEMLHKRFSKQAKLKKEVFKRIKSGEKVDDIANDIINRLKANQAKKEKKEQKINKEQK